MTRPLALHRFTDRGLEEVARQLMLSRTGQPTDFVSLLTKEQLTESLGGPADIVPRDFKNRWACGRFFCEFFAAHSGLIHRDPETDRGLWTWLAIAWRSHLKKPGRSPRSEWPNERWVLGLKYSRYYKHLLAGPWLVYNRYRESPEACRALLLPPITMPGHDISEHFLCKYELVNSPELVAVVGDLYVRTDGRGYKPGVSGSGRGSIRRLREFSGQLELTYDLMSLSRERILDLLPAEFDRFRPTTARRL